MITGTLIDPSNFNDFLNQNENEEIDDPTGLFKVLKTIQQSKCSCGYLCIEIGTINGDFDSLRPKTVEVSTIEQEDVNLIIKPIIIVNNVQDENPNNNGTGSSNMTVNGNKIKVFDEEDCEPFDIVKEAKLLHFKEKLATSKIQRKMYRKVQIWDVDYAKEIFKQGLNIVLVERNKSYTKSKFFFNQFFSV